MHKRSTKLSMTAWKSWSTRNCARDWNLTILPNGTCTNQNQSKKMDLIKSPEIFRCRWITWYLPGDQTQWWLTKKKKKKKKKKLPSGFCCSGGPQYENKRKWNYKQILRPWWLKRLKKLWNIKVTVKLIVELVYLEWSLKAWKADWKNWKLEEV